MPFILWASAEPAYGGVGRGGSRWLARAGGGGLWWHVPSMCRSRRWRPKLADLGSPPLPFALHLQMWQLRWWAAGSRWCSLPLTSTSRSNGGRPDPAECVVKFLWCRYGGEQRWQRRPVDRLGGPIYGFFFLFFVFVWLIEAGLSIKLEKID